VPLAFVTPKVVKYSTGAGTTWVESQDFSRVKIWNGSSWQYIGVRPYADLPLVTFSPDGGAAAPGTFLSDSEYSGYSFVTISASTSVVWSWTVDNANGLATVVSGGSASSITFLLIHNGTARDTTFSVNASNGADNKYWEVFLESLTFE
jgi:hypothetical protein